MVTSSASDRPWKPATITISPASSAARARSGVIRVMRALVWARSVRRPTWGPVSERALSPSACSAMASSAMVTCSPVASSMSISRGSGVRVIWPARPTRPSVVLPIAETTTTSWLLDALSATRRATFLIFSASATDEPPYFCTISAMMSAIYMSRARSGKRAATPHAAVGARRASPSETCSRRRYSQPASVMGTTALAWKSSAYATAASRVTP